MVFFLFFSCRPGHIVNRHRIQNLPHKILSNNEVKLFRLQAVSVWTRIRFYMFGLIYFRLIKVTCKEKYIFFTYKNICCTCQNEKCPGEKNCSQFFFPCHFHKIFCFNKLLFSLYFWQGRFFLEYIFLSLSLSQGEKNKIEENFFTFLIIIGYKRDQLISSQAESLWNMVTIHYRRLL